MNKQELAEKIAKEHELTKAKANEIVDSVFASVEEALVAGDKVAIAGFGIFEVRERSARIGRNPRTGEAVEVPASKAPAFKAGKAFKDAVDK